MEIPKGKHVLEYKYEPTVISIGNIVTLFSYVLLLLIPIGWFVIRRRKNE